MTHCKKSGPVQQMLNIIKHLDKNEFEAHLVTIYPEDSEGSQLENYLPYVEHHYAPTGKLAIILGRDKELKDTLDEIKPDVIHSLGVFPDYAVSRMRKWRQVITLRNYVWEDYPAKFGWLQGGILARLHLYAMKHTAKTVACSESLSKIYKEKLGLEYDFIRNGVDVEQYSRASIEEKKEIRNELGIVDDIFLFVYTGQLIERKNMRFLIDSFMKCFGRNNNVKLLVVGGGAQFTEMKTEYGKDERIIFTGNVNDVSRYLKAGDAYVSASKSEGLPNGVLEAMAAGLPVVLSNIPQHIEIYEANKECGFIFDLNSEDALVESLTHMKEGDIQRMAEAAFVSAHENFSAEKMSKKYQKLYREISKDEFRTKN